VSVRGFLVRRCPPPPGQPKPHDPSHTVPGGPPPHPRPRPPCPLRPCTRTHHASHISSMTSSRAFTSGAGASPSISLPATRTARGRASMKPPMKAAWRGCCASGRARLSWMPGAAWAGPCAWWRPRRARPSRA
jgi:hypothetical protein